MATGEDIVVDSPPYTSVSGEVDSDSLDEELQWQIFEEQLDQFSVDDYEYLREPVTELERINTNSVDIFEAHKMLWMKMKNLGFSYRLYERNWKVCRQANINALRIVNLEKERLKKEECKKTEIVQEVSLEKVESSTGFEEKMDIDLLVEKRDIEEMESEETTIELIREKKEAMLDRFLKLFTIREKNLIKVLGSLKKVKNGQETVNVEGIFEEFKRNLKRLKQIRKKLSKDWKIYNEKEESMKKDILKRSKEIQTVENVQKSKIVMVNKGVQILLDKDKDYIKSDQATYASKVKVNLKKKKDLKEKVSESDWQLVDRKKKNLVKDSNRMNRCEVSNCNNEVMRKVSRPRWSTHRPDALLIKVNNEKDRREAYNRINEEIGKDIMRVRITRAGELLLETKSSGNVDAMKDNLSKCQEAGTDIRILKKSFDLEMRGIDMVSTESDVLEALARSLDIDKDKLKVKVLRHTRIGDQFAVVDTPTNLIEKVMEIKKIKIGLSIVQLCPVVKILKCFRCHMVGHYSGMCTTVLKDLKRCRKCGNDGHEMNDCVDSFCCKDCCKLNLPTEHLIGSISCPIFRQRVYDSKIKFGNYYFMVEKRNEESRYRARRPGRHKEDFLSGEE